MKYFNLFFLLFLTYQFSVAQVASEIYALSNGSSQINFVSNNELEIWGFRMDNDGILRFMANGNDEVMTIDDDNGRNIGMGVDPSDAYQLSVVNNESSSSWRYGIWSRAGGTGTGSRVGVLGWATANSGPRYGIYGSAAQQNDSWGVYCSGNLWYTGSLTSISDRRQKRDIKSFKNGLDLVMGLQPRTYFYRQEESGLNLPKSAQFGFVAQELEKVLPELVETNEHDVFTDIEENEHTRMELKGVNYIGLIPLLTQAIQEQQDIIKQLEARIAILENED